MVMLKGSPVCAVPMALERPATEYRPRNAGAAEIRSSRAEGKLVNGGEIEYLRTSSSLDALSHDRQKEFCGVSDSPPPMLPSLIE